jgi:hypothetical protein
MDGGTRGRGAGWTLPADRWHRGFNRVTVGTPTVASPAAAGLSNDTRQPGVAVREMTLKRIYRAK